MANVATSGVDRVLERRGSNLSDRLDLAGVRTPARDLVVIVGSASVAAIALGLLLGNGVAGLLLALLVPLGTWVWLTIRTSRRRAAFTKQLDETAQLLAGSLRAGYSLGQAVTTVAAEAESPTRDEFTRIGNELRLGRPMGEAMISVAERMRSTDFEWLAQAVAINREVGGNLAEVLEGVGHTLRERAELHRRVDALSAEGKISAYVLGILPFGVAGFVSVLNPGYFDPLFEEPLGWVLLGLAGVMLTVGIFWLRASIKIKY
nr:type II secretion system F family protein [Tessaracoccus sp. OS52]